LHRDPSEERNFAHSPEARLVLSRFRNQLEVMLALRAAPEVLDDGENRLVVDPGRSEELARASRVR
jgi:hypothetical protein